MSRIKQVILGTRGSALALAQAQIVKGALECIPDPPQVELHVIKTTGDQRLDLNLTESGKSFEKGLFTKELEESLLKNEIDIAVHSLKDLPTELRPELELGAVLVRHDPADLLITKEPLEFTQLPMRAIVATSSPRRSLQLCHRRPDLQIVEVRGNIGTRLKKLLREKDWVALVLAKAGLDRIGVGVENGPMDFEGTRLYAVPLSEMLPAAGQGAIGLEVSKTNTEIRSLLEEVNDEETWDCVNAEREFLRLMGGGCQVPIGVRGRYAGEEFQLEAIIFDEKGEAMTGKVGGLGPELSAAALLKEIYGN
jgi:hydroxymethylbilane synthase